MIKLQQEMEHIQQEHACNGNGYIHKQFLFSTEEMEGKAKMCARITLPPGSSIGDHPHQPEAEIYYVLEGEITVTDNDKRVRLHPGDAMFTGGGNRHSATNETDREAVMMAIILW